MSAGSGTRRETAEAAGELSHPPEGPEQDSAPSELESALLTIALFGGLVVFGIGCMLFGWS